MQNNIKYFRQKRCLNIFKLAEVTNISYSYLSALENGIKKNPSYETYKIF